MRALRQSVVSAGSRCHTVPTAATTRRLIAELGQEATVAEKKSGEKAQAQRGRRGAKGKPGAPGIAPGALRAIIADMEQMHADAGIQFHRIAQLQAQLDMTLEALKDMGEQAGRQRKRSRATRG